MAETITVLNDRLFAALQKEAFVILSSEDVETGFPSVNAISWVYAKDNMTIRLAIDSRSRITANIKARPKVAVSLFAEGSFHVIFGEAEFVTEELPGLPFKVGCIDIHIKLVRDAMFYGGRVYVQPEYEKTYDQRAADKLDGQVFEAMKKA